MSDKKDGGPAFPDLKAADWTDRDEGIPNSVVHWRAEGGLTKREWFAGMALQGILACTKDYNGAEKNRGRIAMAYELADAMLAEGNK